MDEAETAGVERLTAKMIDHAAQFGVGNVVAAPTIRVERIPEQRETGFGQMNPDLVGTSGLQPQLHE
jgi:hypothetical protein